MKWHGGPNLRGGSEIEFSFIFDWAARCDSIVFTLRFSRCAIIARAVTLAMR